VAAEQRRAWDRSVNPGAVTEEILHKVGIAEVADFMVGTLPTGTARLVELARALATGPKALLLDEPSSGLNEEETEDMARLLRTLVKEGLGVLLVEHDMSFVMGTCEYIYVLDFGKIIAQGTPLEVQADAAVQAAYLGTAATEVVA
jgi:branched-chain amino acid transport system ATP-binding protein